MADQNSTISPTSVRENGSAVVLGNGQYEFQLQSSDKLGEGGFGTVYRGEDTVNNKLVAIKVIRKGKVRKMTLERLTGEAKFMKSVKHANIVSFLNGYQNKEHLYLVIEYCNGHDLAHYIKRNFKLPESTVRHFVPQIRQAMQALKDKRIVHRDLKPQNILLSYDASIAPSVLLCKVSSIVVKIADFGLARHLSEGEMMKSLVGTPVYMAPEVFLNDSYDIKVDLFAIGVIIYECLIGRLPFGPQVMPNKYGEVFPKLAMPANASSDMLAFVQKLLQPDPLKRLSFDEFIKHPGGNACMNHDYWDLPEDVIKKDIIIGDPQTYGMNSLKSDMSEQEFRSCSHIQRGKFLFMNHAKSDVTFVIKSGNEKHNVPGHKSILKENYLMIANMIREVKFSYSSLMSVIRFLYTGELVIDVGKRDAVYDILSLSGKLNQNIIKQKIIDCQDLRIVSQSWQMLRYSYDLKDNDVRSASLKSLDSHGHRMIMRSEFLRLPAEAITEIVSRTTFACHEYELFKACVKWSKDKCSPKESDNVKIVRQKMSMFFNKIRFPCMERQQLLEIESMKILTSDELLDIYKTFIFPDFRSQFISEERIAPTARDLKIRQLSSEEADDQGSKSDGTHIQGKGEEQFYSCKE